MLNNMNPAHLTAPSRTVAEVLAHVRAGIGACIPPALKQGWMRDPVELDIHAGDGSVGPCVRTENGTTAVDLTYLEAMRQRWGATVSATVLVPLHHCFVRDLTLPKAAAPRVDEILSLDLERTTPFRASQVLTGWYRLPDADTGGTMTVRQIVLQRQTLDGLLADIKTARLPLKAITVADASGTRLPANLLERGLRQRAPAIRWLRNIIAAEAIGLLTFAAIGLGLTLTNLNTGLATANADVDKATKQVQIIRRQLSDADSAAALLRQPRLRKIETPAVLAVWEDVTKALPDSTWLTEMRVDDGNVQIDGQSANASELISVLSKLGIFTNVAFASPVTRDPQRGVERFQIKLQTAKRDSVSLAKNAQPNPLQPKPTEVK